MTNVEAAELMWSALRLNITEADTALAVAVVSLAHAVDANPDNASLWREYQAALRTLRDAGSGGSTDEFEKILSALRGSPEVVHAAD